MSCEIRKEDLNPPRILGTQPKFCTLCHILFNVCGFRKGHSIIYLPNGDTSTSECGIGSFHAYARTEGVDQESDGQIEVDGHPNLSYQLFKQYFKPKRYQVGKGEENMSQAECWSNRLSGKEDKTVILRKRF